LNEEVVSQAQTGTDDNPLSSFIHSDLVVVGLEAKDKEEVVRKLAAMLLEKGYVKESYANAVLAREKLFPTGLPTQDVHVAIPHTDVEHCIKPAIAVAVLKQPVEFFEMATLDKLVHPEIIFLLSIVRPKDQVEWLQRLVSLFQQEGFLAELRKSKDAASCYQLLYSSLENLKEQGV
jgi:PTS system galactitol-specific IIA component